MRAEFLSGLADLADIDDRIVLITADLGFGAIEGFIDRHPGRFFNLGVTEQAIAGLAAGLAEGGFIPYCYSIATFAVSRTFEFLRNGAVAHRLPVRVVGVGPGLDYSYDGLTHYALEDLALICSQPETKVIAPVDEARARLAGSTPIDHPGLVYYRLSRSAPACPLPLVDDANLSAPCVVLGLGDASRVATRLLDELLAASIPAKGAAVELLDQDSISNLAERLVATETAVVVTAESHYVRGGFGTMLGDELAQRAWGGTLVKWGVESLPVGPLGGPTDVERRYCTSSVSVIHRASAVLAGSVRTGSAS